MLPPRPSTALSFESLFAQAQWLKAWIDVDRVWLAMPLLMQGDDDEVRERVKAVAAAAGLRITAAGDVLMATRAAKPLQDGNAFFDRRMGCEQTAEIECRRRVLDEHLPHFGRNMRHVGVL